MKRAPLLLPVVLFASATSATAQAPFRVEEATIAQIHQAFTQRQLTCRQLVDQYLARIEAYDKTGPALNAIVIVNPDARKTADSLDAQFSRRGLTGPLHCIPMIVKDNFETTDLPTTAGSLSLQGFLSSQDATMVQRIRAAGALVLVKSNMAEFAFSPQETVNSILPGHTRNPYDTSRTTAGSSGGTAAAVAASFGAAGLGTDTGNSIRGPSSHQALVGIRSTMGLTSRAGVIPLSYAADIAGPMARTVADAVAVFQVVAGYDPRDTVTAASRARQIPEYSRSLVVDGLRGARIGVLRQAITAAPADSEVMSTFARAVADMRRAGATVLDTVRVSDLDSLQGAFRGGGCNRFKFDLERWIAGTGGRTPVKSLDEIIASGKFHASVRQRLQSSATATVPPEESPGCRNRALLGVEIARSLTRLMDTLRLDALIYPTWSHPPRLITGGGPTGDNSQLFSPITGWPAIQVPIGYTRNNTLPAGMTILGRAWSEDVLIRLAYSYEQATKHRKAPALTPPMRE
jgi:Asp-tRNA(Asn)/Glu-tRNA(Gln) amidotransferase A subunit family amidase